MSLGDGSTIEASLLVAADGARSKLRERAGIATHGWDYDQSGIVVTVGHERDHHGRAEEHFLPAGPFAILPLKGARSSLVWTEDRTEAARIIALSDDEFHANSNRVSGCISARSRRWTGRARFRSAISWRAPSSASGWRWSAMPRM